MKQLFIIALLSMSVIAGHTLAIEGKTRNTIPPLDSTVVVPEGATEYCIDFIGFNTARDPLDDPLVRKALAAGADRVDIPLFFEEYATPAMTFTPPGIFGHIDGFEEGVGVPYDPAQAQQWLAQAGFPGGQDFPRLSVHYPSPVEHYDRNFALQPVQADWGDNLGIGVEIVVEEISTFLNGLVVGEFPAFYYYWCTDAPQEHDADYFLDDGISSFRTALGGWDDATYNGLVEQASNNSDPAAALSLYTEAEEILVEQDVVVYPLFYFRFDLQPTIYLPLLIGND